MRCIRAVRFERPAQSAEPRIGLREMMENPGADDLIEARFQVACPLDGKLADLEIVQAVFPLELLGTAHARCAEVDAGNPSRRPAQGMLGRLRCPAAGNEDGLILPIGPCGPEEMIVRAAFLPVLPELSIFLEAVDRGWIRDAVRRTRALPAPTLAASALCCSLAVSQTIRFQPALGRAAKRTRHPAGRVSRRWPRYASRH